MCFETDESPTLSRQVVADVGGTFARFAEVDGALRPVRERVLVCADHEDFETLFKAYLDTVHGERPLRAAVAIANPICGDKIAMTNSDWSFSIDRVRRQLALDELWFVNDFTAQAMALPWLHADDVVPIGGVSKAPSGTKAVLGPGTGLGVSGLIDVGGNWIPLASEGGHATVSPVNPRETAIVGMCQRRFEHVSVERLISGNGLENLYSAICQLNDLPVAQLSAADISQRAVARTDVSCIEALETFCSLLGTTAGNLALTLGATGGVYVSGGILPRLGSYLANSSFRERFEAKGRLSSYLARIPTYLVRAPNPALLGLAKAFGPFQAFIEDFRALTGQPLATGNHADSLSRPSSRVRQPT